MSKLKLLSSLFVLFAATASHAAIDCRPGMGGGCPGPQDPVPRPPGGGIGRGQPTEVVGIGYIEVASPDCTDEDLAKAKELAEEIAFRRAQRDLKTDDVVLSKPFHYQQRCGLGIYANSNKEVSWIVQAFGRFQASPQ